ncbi:MAG: hypothetical protein AAF702_01215 [Chloroflexota bacterium]
MKNSSMMNIVSDTSDKTYISGVINIDTQAAVLGVDPYLFLDSINRPSTVGQSAVHAASAVRARNSQR